MREGPAPGSANLPIGIGNSQPKAKNSDGARDPHWHSRGYLPHFDDGERIQHVTLHLADSLPAEAVKRITLDLEAIAPNKRSAEKRQRLEAWLDAGHGKCILSEPVIAQICQDTLLHFDSRRYRMLAWVIMPNHIHALFQSINGWAMGNIVGSWKKFTARAIRDFERARMSGNESGLRPFSKANREIGAPRGGAPHVWHREYWDRYIRNQEHLRKTVEYIHQNPVTAGLVRSPQAWCWSSAAPHPSVL